MRATTSGMGRAATAAGAGSAAPCCGLTPEDGSSAGSAQQLSALRSSLPIPNARRCVVEHQGNPPVRIVHQPDGSIVCEPLVGYKQSHAVADSGVAAGAVSDGFVPSMCREAIHVARALGCSVALVGAGLGFFVSCEEAYDAKYNNRPVDHRKVIKTVQEVVRCCVVGTLTGAVVAPASAVLGIVRLAVRPALLGLALHGAARWVARHHVGAAALLKKLQSGDFSRQLDALRQLIHRLAASTAFCDQFKKLAGVEVLLKMLADMLAAVERGSTLLGGPQAALTVLGGPQAALTVRALAELSKQGDAVDTMVELGGIPLLLRAASYGLGHGSSSGAVGAAPGAGPALSCPALVLHASAALARIASKNAVAQQVLASDPGTSPLVVALLRGATERGLKGATVEACDELRGHAVTLAQALALEPVGKSAMGNAGGVEALSAALMLSTPWTLGQATAAAALHALVRGDVDNQRRLAALAPAGLSTAINRALASASGGGPLVASPPPAGPTAARAGASPQAGEGQAPMMLLGEAGRALAPQDCHAHRADLLALSNVIARMSSTAPTAAITIGSQSSSGRSSPTGLLTPPLATSPPAATTMQPAAAAPTKQPAFLQRLRLRPASKPAPPADSVKPVTAPAAPTKTPTSAAGATEVVGMTIAAAAAPVLVGEVVDAAVVSQAESKAAAAESKVGGGDGGECCEALESEDWDCSLESNVVEEEANQAVA